jgi:hypothetical protein
VLFLLLVSCNRNKDIALTNNYKPLHVESQSTLRFLGHWLDEGKKKQILNDAITKFEFLHQDCKIKLDYLERTNKDFSVYNASQIISYDPEWDILKINGNFVGLDNNINKVGWEKKYLVDFSEIPAIRETTLPEFFKIIHES